MAEERGGLVLVVAITAIVMCLGWEADCCKVMMISWQCDTASSSEAMVGQAGGQIEAFLSGELPVNAVSRLAPVSCDQNNDLHLLPPMLYFGPSFEWAF